MFSLKERAMRIPLRNLVMVIALAASLINGCNGAGPIVKDDIAQNPKVKEGFKDAWVKTKPENASDTLTGEEHEEGGWIVRDTKTGEISIFPTAPGKPNPVSPSEATLPARTYFEDPATKKKFADEEGKFEIIGGYHTHPFGGATRLTHPSDVDKQEADKVGVPEYVVSEDGVHKYDPSKTDNPETTDKDERVTEVEEKKDTDARNEAAKKAKSK
jgi:proteasome lid subunit RPN8/RPN11